MGTKWGEIRRRASLLDWVLALQRWNRAYRKGQTGAKCRVRKQGSSKDWENAFCETNIEIRV